MSKEIVKKDVFVLTIIFSLIVSCSELSETTLPQETKLSESYPNVECQLSSDLSNFASLQHVIVQRGYIKFVPPEFQQSALNQLIEKTFDNDPSIEQISDSSNSIIVDTGDKLLKPTLVKGCFYYLPDTGNENRFRRATINIDFTTHYYPSNDTLLIYHFALASAGTNPKPAALVIWHNEPIENVLIITSSAE